MNNKTSKRHEGRKAIVIAIFSAIGMVIGSLNAAVVNITEGSTTGYTMTEGNTYVVQNSVAFSNSTVGGSGMSVEDGATVVLYVPQGVTLTAVGANGSGRTGGGAGVSVPSNATLVITGEGEVLAKGGNAGDGNNGSNGAAGSYNPGSHCWSGTGGAGGDGGGGAGAAIGGKGGGGGTHGEKSGCMFYNGYTGETLRSGGTFEGGNGGEGEVSDTMGNVFVLGRILMQNQGGERGVNGNAGMTSKSVVRLSATYGGTRYVGGGGGGGGGGAGAAPNCPIGAGGQSGGGGGGGGCGAVVVAGGEIEVHGGGGIGGYSKVVAGESGGAKSNYGGEGGAGGAAGAAGGDGELYVSTMAVVDVDRVKLSAETHVAAQYTITFDSNGGTLVSEVNKVTATLGCALPDCIPTPVREKYMLCGWRDENGIEYYKGDGTKMLSSYSVPSGIVLYAEWAIDPNNLVLTPSDGTVFEGSVTIAMSSSVAGAMIRYTLDGSDPTIDSPVYKKFKISERTTVKAVAFYEDGSQSDVVTCEYAPGRCADPIVSPVDGTVFKRSGQIVTIDKNGEEGVLRYTIDGTEPTAGSPVYEGPFTVDDSTVVKAKVFSDRYFDSAVVTVNLTREWETVATPVITAVEEFTGSETKVVLACATPEATICYTTDGSEPNSHSSKYTGPFWVSEGCTVKAVAMRVEYRMSEIASRTITKVWGIGDTMGAPDHAFATSGDAGFVRVEDETAPKGEAMRSGEIGDSAGYDLYSRSVLSTTVHGPCTLKFKWRCSCEDDYDWDHAEFAVDGDVKARICGVMDGWAEFTQVITEDGAHAVTWTYLKDSSEKVGADCLWVADYSWTPTELYTHESSVPVPYDWILTYLPHTAYEYDHFEAAVRETAANRVHTVEAAYVAGLDPSDPKDKFIAKIEMIDGKSVVTWTPDLNEDGTKSVRTYKTWGKNSLEADEWLEVTPENHDDMRFFKVTVDMP